MICTKILFTLKDEVKNAMDKDQVREHLKNLVEQYKNVPGLTAKYFFMNPDNMDQGAFLIWESQEMVDSYLKSDLYKSAVADICVGTPEWETYVLTASLQDGVLI